jgi:hypothetical protein
MISLSRKARTLKSEKLTFYSRSYLAVIRVYDETSDVIETHEHAGEFKESYNSFFSSQATILGFLDNPVEAARRFWIL